ncbi:HEPN domain-containing protein [Candidatus Woesearchaeota archaeon]|nr:HEPN domain-containing protein [Candidatus Woesearchaeota archaeon]
MDSEHKEVLYLERAANELDLARAVFLISTQNSLKPELELKEDATFFSNVISSAYYCIFYAAKALLIKKGIETKAPDEHKKTLNEFEKLVLSGEIDAELLRIYKTVVMKADVLLGIFRLEKSKRGDFTYKKLPQTNREPAEESIRHAEKFFRNMKLMVKK